MNKATRHEITNNTMLITYEQARERYNLGRNVVMKLAKESGALVKIGKAARVDVETMDNYIKSLMNH